MKKKQKIKINRLKSKKSPTENSPAKPKKLTANKKVNEEDFLIALDNVTKKLVYKFRFGYHDVEDMKQQATIFALEGIELYDHKRPLENFLWTHIHNRLFNFKRNNYKRPDSPCTGCPFNDPQMIKSQNGCMKFTDKESCDLYRPWLDRNKNKQNIMSPSLLDHDLYTTKDLSDNVADLEILSEIENNLSGEYREYYIRLKSGEKLSKQKLEKLKAHIKSILNHNEVPDDNE